MKVAEALVAGSVMGCLVVLLAIATRVADDHGAMVDELCHWRVEDVVHTETLHQVVQSWPECGNWVAEAVRAKAEGASFSWDTFPASWWVPEFEYMGIPFDSTEPGPPWFSPPVYDTVFESAAWVICSDRRWCTLPSEIDTAGGRWPDEWAPR